MKIFNGFLIGYLNAVSIPRVCNDCIFYITENGVDEQIAELTVRVDELAAEQESSKLRADSIENSLVNNNLLTSCTIQGSTDAWKASQQTGAFEVEGYN